MKTQEVSMRNTGDNTQTKEDSTRQEGRQAQHKHRDVKQRQHRQSCQGRIL